MVPGAGIEPALPFENRFLRPARLPVPPPGRIVRTARLYGKDALRAAFCPNVAGCSAPAQRGGTPGAHGWRAPQGTIATPAVSVVSDP